MSRADEIMALGYHPASGLRLLSPPAPERSCGSCDLRRAVVYRDRTYHKCTAFDVVGPAANPPTHGAATDVRLKWRACRIWRQRTEASMGGSEIHARVLAELRAMRDEAGFAPASMTTAIVAERTKLSSESVRGALQGLEEDGLVRRRERHGSLGYRWELEE